MFRVGPFARIGLSRFVSSLAFPNSPFAARSLPLPRLLAASGTSLALTSVLGSVPYIVISWWSALI